MDDSGKPASERLLSVKDLRAWDTALKMGAISFSARGGDLITVHGGVGAGKSAALLAIGGYKTSAPGCVTFDGADLYGVAPYSLAKMGIALVQQEGALFRGLTAEQNIRIAVELSRGREGLSWQETKARLLEVAPQIVELLPRKAEVLSGGQKRLVALLRAYSVSPKLAIIDEGLSGLDHENRSWAEDLIAKILDAGAVVVLALQSGDVLSLKSALSIELTPGVAARVL